MSFFGNLLDTFEDGINKAKTSAYKMRDSVEEKINDARASLGKGAADILSNYGHGAGFNDASDALDHYQYGDGKDIHWPRDNLKKYGTIMKAEKTNHDRLLDSLPKTDKLYKLTNGLKQPVLLKDVKENEHIYLDDHFDVDHKEYDRDQKEENKLYPFLGRFKMRSEGKLQFVKFKDKLLLRGGYVQHDINDRYDFDKEPFKTTLLPLEKSGKAKVYNNKSSWKTYPIGVIKIDDDKLDTSGIEWHLLP